MTNHKDPVSEEAKKTLANTKVWRYEYDFYNFAKKIFNQERADRTSSHTYSREIPKLRSAYLVTFNMKEKQSSNTNTFNLNSEWIETTSVYKHSKSCKNKEIVFGRGKT